MANHVNSYLRFHEVNEAGLEVLKKLFERFEKHRKDYECHLGFAFVDNQDDIDSTLMNEKVGAKWAYVQDWDEHGMSMYSAWRQPEEFVQYVVESVAEADPKSIAILTYEDEMPNFIGADIYYDQIRENLCRRYEDLNEQWDADDEEWLDDGDLYFEYIWDYIEEWQNEM